LGERTTNFKIEKNSRGVGKKVRRRRREQETTTREEKKRRYRTPRESRRQHS